MAEKPADPATKLLGLIGLGARGGMIAIGVDATRASLQRKDCFVVVVAADATVRSGEKVVRLARATGIPVVSGPDATRLGAQLGRPPMMVVGVRDRALAAGVLAMQGRSGPDGGVSGQE